MNDELIAAVSEAEIAGYTEAMKLHIEIMSKGKIVADAMVDFCKGLKRMRDEKLYIELGYEDFGAYAEGMVGLKQRQAYHYIAVLENLGEKLLQSTAGAGIEKLKLLASIPGIERETFVEENNLNDLTVKELRELTEKYNQQTEQISLLADEKEVLEQNHTKLLRMKDEESAARIDAEQKLAKEREKSKKVQDKLAKAKEEKDALERRVKELEAQPVEVAVEQYDIEELTKVRQEAEENAAKKYQEQLAQQEKDLEEARKTAEEALRKAEQAKAAAKATGTGIQKVAFLVENLQKTAAELTASLEQAEKESPDQAEKYRAAVKKLFGMMGEKF